MLTDKTARLILVLVLVIGVVGYVAGGPGVAVAAMSVAFALAILIVALMGISSAPSKKSTIDGDTQPLSELPGADEEDGTGDGVIR